jgi:hypothetical protein
MIKHPVSLSPLPLFVVSVCFCHQDGEMLKSFNAANDGVDYPISGK